MAEEIDIRALWNKGKEMESTVSIDFEAIEKGKTKSTLYWLQFILRIEFWLNIVLVPWVIYELFFKQDEPVLGVISLVIQSVYFIYYLFLIRKINRFNFADDVVRSLKKLYGYLNFYLLHYKVVIWISLVLGTIRGYYEGVEGGDPTVFEMTTSERWTFFLIMLGTILVVGAIMTFLIHLIYGRKIKRLKGYVNDLTRIQT